VQAGGLTDENQRVLSAQTHALALERGAYPGRTCQQGDGGHGSQEQILCPLSTLVNDFGSVSPQLNPTTLEPYGRPLPFPHLSSFTHAHCAIFVGPSSTLTGNVTLTLGEDGPASCHLFATESYLNTSLLTLESPNLALVLDGGSRLDTEELTITGSGALVLGSNWDASSVRELILDGSAQLHLVQDFGATGRPPVLLDDGSLLAASSSVQATGFAAADRTTIRTADTADAPVVVLPPILRRCDATTPALVTVHLGVPGARLVATPVAGTTRQSELEAALVPCAGAVDTFAVSLESATLEVGGWSAGGAASFGSFVAAEATTWATMRGLLEEGAERALSAGDADDADGLLAGHEVGAYSACVEVGAGRAASLLGRYPTVLRRASTHDSATQPSDDFGGGEEDRAALFASAVDSHVCLTLPVLGVGLGDEGRSAVSFSHFWSSNATLALHPRLTSRSSVNFHGGATVTLASVDGRDSSTNRTFGLAVQLSTDHLESGDDGVDCDVDGGAGEHQLVVVVGAEYASAPLPTVDDEAGWRLVAVDVCCPIRQFRLTAARGDDASYDQECAEVLSPAAIAGVAVAAVVGLACCMYLAIVCVFGGLCFGASRAGRGAVASRERRSAGWWATAFVVTLDSGLAFWSLFGFGVAAFSLYYFTAVQLVATRDAVNTFMSAPLANATGFLPYHPTVTAAAMSDAAGCDDAEYMATVYGAGPLLLESSGYRAWDDPNYAVIIVVSLAFDIVAFVILTVGLSTIGTRCWPNIVAKPWYTGTMMVLDIGLFVGSFVAMAIAFDAALSQSQPFVRTGLETLVYSTRPDWPDGVLSSGSIFSGGTFETSSAHPVIGKGHPLCPATHYADFPTDPTGPQCDMGVDDASATSQLLSDSCYHSRLLTVNYSVTVCEDPAAAFPADTFDPDRNLLCTRTVLSSVESFFDNDLDTVVVCPASLNERVYPTNYFDRLLLQFPEVVVLDDDDDDEADDDDDEAEEQPGRRLIDIDALGEVCSGGERAIRWTDELDADAVATFVAAYGGLATLDSLNIGRSTEMLSMFSDRVCNSTLAIGQYICSGFEVCDGLNGFLYGELGGAARKIGPAYLASLVMPEVIDMDPWDASDGTVSQLPDGLTLRFGRVRPLGDGVGSTDQVALSDPIVDENNDPLFAWGSAGNNVAPLLYVEATDLLSLLHAPSTLVINTGRGGGNTCEDETFTFTVSPDAEVIPVRTAIDVHLDLTAGGDVDAMVVAQTSLTQDPQARSGFSTDHVPPVFLNTVLPPSFADSFFPVDETSATGRSMSTDVLLNRHVYGGVALHAIEDVPSASSPLPVGVSSWTSALPYLGYRWLDPVPLSEDLSVATGFLLGPGAALAMSIDVPVRAVDATVSGLATLSASMIVEHPSSVRRFPSVASDAGPTLVQASDNGRAATPTLTSSSASLVTLPGHTLPVGYSWVRFAFAGEVLADAEFDGGSVWVSVTFASTAPESSPIHVALHSQRDCTTRQYPVAYEAVDGSSLAALPSDVARPPLGVVVDMPYNLTESLDVPLEVGFSCHPRYLIRTAETVLIQNGELDDASRLVDADLPYAQAVREGLNSTAPLAAPRIPMRVHVATAAAAVTHGLYNGTKEAHEVLLSVGPSLDPAFVEAAGASQGTFCQLACQNPFVSMAPLRNHTECSNVCNGDAGSGNSEEGDEDGSRDDEEGKMDKSVPCDRDGLCEGEMQYCHPVSGQCTDIVSTEQTRARLCSIVSRPLGGRRLAAGVARAYVADPTSSTLASEQSSVREVVRYDCTGSIVLADGQIASTLTDLQGSDTFVGVMFDVPATLLDLVTILLVYGSVFVVPLCVSAGCMTPSTRRTIPPLAQRQCSPALTCYAPCAAVLPIPMVLFWIGVTVFFSITVANGVGTFSSTLDGLFISLVGVGFVVLSAVVFCVGFARGKRTLASQSYVFRNYDPDAGSGGGVKGMSAAEVTRVESSVRQALGLYDETAAESTSPGGPATTDSSGDTTEMATVELGNGASAEASATRMDRATSSRRRKKVVDATKHSPDDDEAEKSAAQNDEEVRDEEDEVTKQESDKE